CLHYQAHKTEPVPAHSTSSNAEHSPPVPNTSSNDSPPPRDHPETTTVDDLDSNNHPSEQARIDYLNFYMQGVRANLMNDTATAYEYFRKNYDLNPSSHVAEKILALDPDRHNTELILKKAQKMALLHPKNTNILVTHGRLLSSVNRLEEAYSQFKQAIAIKPRNETAYYFWIETLMSQQQWSEALQVVASLKSVRGDLLLPWLLELRIFIKTSQFQKARAAGEKLRKKEPRDRGTQLMLAYVYVKLKQTQKASELYRKLELSGANFASQERITQTKYYEILDGYDQATHALQQLIQALPENKHSYHEIFTKELMWIYFEQKNMPQVSKLLSEYQQHPTRDLTAEMSYVLALAYEQQGQKDAALATLKTIPESSIFAPPAYTKIFLLLSEPYHQGERNLQDFLRDQDLENTAALIEGASPPSAMSLYLTGSYYYKKGNFQKAREILTNATMIFPQNRQLTFWLGLVHFELGDLQISEKIYRDMLADIPLDPGILNALGYTLALRGEKLDEAVSLLQTALELQPDDPAITDSLGWAYFMAKNYSKAQELLEKAYALKPHDAEINEHLVALYLALGQCAQAKKHMDIAYKNMMMIPGMDKIIARKQQLGESCNMSSPTP
ncbi:MAG: tetratricopeptide repeat protein, partial [Proteobacteria bacterium]|nr:tetratricopeptide repeat protein [Pseudomonadota bacterium]